MSMTASSMRALEAAAMPFNSSNHVRFIEEASQHLRMSRDPIATLRFLAALWGSPYAQRPFELRALNDIGDWFEKRIERRPPVAPATLSEELGWLKRLARFSEARQMRSGRTDFDEKGKEKPRREFGERIEAIKTARSAPQQPDRQQVAGPSKTPPPIAVAAPTSLPTKFGLRFENFTEARDAYRNIRERRKKGKPDKERLLLVVPTDKALVNLGKGLVVSSSMTEGFDSLFGAVLQNAGREVPFFATELAPQVDGNVLVKRLSLQPSLR